MTTIYKKGITIIELLLVIMLLGIFSALVVAELNSYRRSQALKTSAAQIQALLDEARSNTLASLNSSVYGIHLEDDSVTLFTGSTYSSSDTDNIVVDLDSAVEIVDIDLEGGGDDVIFDRLTGATEDYGTFILSVRADPDRALTFTIHETGVATSN